MIPRAPDPGRAHSLTIGRIMTSNATTHVHITRPAFSTDSAISATLLMADAAPLIPSRTNVGTYRGVRLTSDGPAYVVGKSGRVIGLHKGQKIDSATADAIAQALASGAFVDLSYAGCHKAASVLETSQRVADHWQETGKAFDPSDIPTMVGAVRSAIVAGKAGASKPDQIFEILADVDYSPAEAVKALAKAVEDSRRKASKSTRKAPASKSLTLKAFDAVDALATAVESGEIPAHDELSALVGAFARLQTALKATESNEGSKAA